MRYVRRGYFLLVLALALGASLSAQAQPVRTVTLPGPGYVQHLAHGRTIFHPREAVADRLLVVLQPGVSALSAGAPEALAAAGGGKLRHTLARGRVLVVDLPAGSDLQAAAARYRQLPQVAAAEPDGFVYPSLVPNDPMYNQQYYLPLMQAPAAWNVTTGSSSTVIAFIDSGVDITHPDLAANIWNNPNPGATGSAYPDDIHGWDFVDNNNNVEPVPLVGGNNEIVAHGTLTAGIAAAVGNDGYGVAGIDWAAKIMECRVFDHDGSGATNDMVVQAMDYAVARGAKVINMSLGGPWADVYTAAVESAYAAGVVIVVAAGNDDMALTDSYKESPVCNDGPSGAEEVIGVAATDQNDLKADFSNWDDSTARTYVAVCAPGVNIYGDSFYDGSAEFNSYFQTNSGTSFSTPMVSGLAALILAQHPTYTPAQVLAAIKGGADNIDTLNPGYAGMLGAGRLNLARSLGVVSPPQPVQNVQAANTVNSLGGSITVTWLKSTDDGGGAKSVTKYTVMRRQGTTGNFTALNDVAPGTQIYIDNTTTDGLPYYYQVRTWAGTLYSDSTIAGPVESSDDEPPPEVTTLTAINRPNDNGGAINLSWTYTPPAAFAAYRIYRDGYAFTTVTGRTPLATITDKTATSYTDATTTDGVDYYYAITCVDTFGNEDQTVISVGPVESFPTQNVTLPAGTQLMGTPVLPPNDDPTTLFGLSTTGLQYAVYDTADSKYLYYTAEPLPTDLRLALGAGFWIQFPQALTIAPNGQVAPAGDFPASLLTGWDLLGNPFFATLDFSACTVTTGTTTMDLSSAQAAGLISSVAWIYDTTAKGYRMVNGGTGGTTVTAWQGFWVHGMAPCTLNLTRPVAASSLTALSAKPAHSAVTAQAKPVVAWQLRLTAQAGPYNDLDKYCGVASVPEQVESPPLPGAGVELALGTDPAGPVALKYYPTGTTTITQPVTVSWMGVTGTVRLAWPEINTLPAGQSFVLQDLATGQTVNLRDTPEYVFQATQATGQRAFTLSVAPASNSVLTVNALSVQPANSGEQLVFVLSKSANCDIKIMNIAGRVVRQVLTGVLQPAGANTVLWDGRNGLGVRVPNGLYLVSLEARDDQGNVAHAVSDLSLDR